MFVRDVFRSRWPKSSSSSSSSAPAAAILCGRCSPVSRTVQIFTRRPLFFFARQKEGRHPSKKGKTKGKILLFLSLSFFFFSYSPFFSSLLFPPSKKRRERIPWVLPVWLWMPLRSSDRQRVGEGVEELVVDDVASVLNRLLPLVGVPQVRVRVHPRLPEQHVRRARGRLLH
jgi:hypothetical protein